VGGRLGTLSSVLGGALLPSQNATLQDIVFTQNGPGTSGIEASERTFRRIVLTAPIAQCSKCNPTRADGVVMVVCLDVDSFH
jgi:hypothetical protein